MMWAWAFEAQYCASSAAATIIGAHHAVTIGQPLLAPTDVATRPLGAPMSAASWPGSSEGTTPSQASPCCCKAGTLKDPDAQFLVSPPAAVDAQGLMAPPVPLTS